MQVGVAGTGRMGTAIAQRLLARGHAVVVWNRTAEKTTALVEAGATAAPTPAALAGAVDVVVTILTDAAAVDAVYGGPQGLLAGEVAARLFVDMSTVLPEVEVALAERVRAAGAGFVECPVGGTVAPAREGKLIGFAAGTAADVERAMPLLGELCRRVETVGAVGNGARLKLAINLPLAVYWQALGEALALCREVGLDGAAIADLFADSSAGPNVLRNRAAVVAKALDGEPVPGTFDVDQMRKDLRTMLEQASTLGTELPVAQAALGALDLGSAAGLGDRDGAVQSAFWASRRG
jgi:3-hydroxyisobutyrate dehydrogenase